VTQVRFCKVWITSSRVFSNGWQWATAISNPENWGLKVWKSVL
jgi:hypothetical protein